LNIFDTIAKNVQSGFSNKNGVPTALSAGTP